MDIQIPDLNYDNSCGKNYETEPSYTSLHLQLLYYGNLQSFCSQYYFFPRIVAIPEIQQKHHVVGSSGNL